jgi:hypothetical protein
MRIVLRGSNRRIYPACPPATNRVLPWRIAERRDVDFFVTDGGRNGSFYSLSAAEAQLRLFPDPPLTLWTVSSTLVRLSAWKEDRLSRAHVVLDRGGGSVRIQLPDFIEQSLGVVADLLWSKTVLVSSGINGDPDFAASCPKKKCKLLWESKSRMSWTTSFNSGKEKTDKSSLIRFSYH